MCRREVWLREWCFSEQSVPSRLRLGRVSLQALWHVPWRSRFGQPTAPNRRYWCPAGSPSSTTSACAAGRYGTAANAKDYTDNQCEGACNTEGSVVGRQGHHDRDCSLMVFALSPAQVLLRGRVDRTQSECTKVQGGLLRSGKRSAHKQRMQRRLQHRRVRGREVGPS